MTSPFDDEAATFLVLASAGAHCLWPAWAEIPAGWAVAHGPVDRPAGLRWIESSVSGAARRRRAPSA